MLHDIDAFLPIAAESFELRGPIYEFSYHPPPAPMPGSSPDETAVPRRRQTHEAAAATWPLLEEGNEGDRLEDLGRLPFPDRAAGTVICMGALQHVAEPDRAVREMTRILSPGGLLLVWCPFTGPTPEWVGHGWQATPEVIGRLLSGLQATLVGWQGGEQAPHMVLGIGCKAPVPRHFLLGANRFVERFQGRLDEAAARGGWWRRLVNLLAGVVQSADERQRARDFYRTGFVLHAPVKAELEHPLSALGLSDQTSGSRFRG